MLTPFSWVFQQLAGRKRRRSETHQARYQSPIPIIVVGNITAGGTGKTPVVIALAKWLTQEGYKPGVISRGFGGASKHLIRVSAASDPALVGDEPLMIEASTGVPTICCRDRVQAAIHLSETTDCNVIISDDGLQHYPLPRNFEIVVIDGLRGFGNGRLLPAGPLREKPSRLQEVDCILVNGPDQFEVAPASALSIAVEIDHLLDAKTAQTVSLDVIKRKSVHGVAGIGHPQRFFQTLSGLGCSVIEHPWPDHAPFGEEDLNFHDDLPVVMTEKDYSRCRALDFKAIRAPVLVLVVRLDLPDALKEKIRQALQPSD
ncbi:MAG: tetraacyldisaccharide 4'-kinase [Pseudomonadales bacterium]|nr:tetraacyldisaccharide 4'-kinase [Pseudomonadales bacterium]